MAPSCPLGSTSEKGDGEMNILGLPGGPAVLGVWVYENRPPNWIRFWRDFHRVWEVLRAPTWKYLGRSQGRGERRKWQRCCGWQGWGILLRQCPRQLAGIFFLSGPWQARAKKQKAEQVGEGAAWRAFSVLCLLSRSRVGRVESYTLSLNLPN